MAKFYGMGCVLLGVALGAMTGCTSTTDADAAATTSERLIPASLPGWRIVGRLSPKERKMFGGATLPETVQLRGVREDGAARKYLLYVDTDPRPSWTVPIYVDVRVAADGSSVANDLTATPWMDGQGFYFPGEADVMTAMRTTDFATYNGDVVHWADPKTWLLRDQKVIDGFLGYRCSAHGQSAGVQDICDGVVHAGTVGIKWGKFGFDTLQLDDGSLVFAMQPYPWDTNRYLGFNRLKLTPSRGLEGHEVPPLLVAVNNEYFSPDSVTLTGGNGKAYAVLAGRTGVHGPEGKLVEHHSLIATRYNYETDATAKVAQYEADVIQASMGARDPVSGKLAYIAEFNSPKELPLPAGVTQLKRRGEYKVVLFDPATEQFQALGGLPRLQMQTTANPGYVFSTGDMMGHDPTTARPENLLWSEGKLYVWWVETVLRPDVSSVVRELVVMTPE
jgi:hypothetical protein